MSKPVAGNDCFPEEETDVVVDLKGERQGPPTAPVLSPGRRPGAGS